MDAIKFRLRRSHQDQLNNTLTSPEIAMAVRIVDERSSSCSGFSINGRLSRPPILRTAVH